MGEGGGFNVVHLFFLTTFTAKTVILPLYIKKPPIPCETGGERAEYVMRCARIGLVSSD
jgi:hypothetical protein